MTLRFRNVDADPADPVSTWPYEGLVTAIERGTLRDWRRVPAVLADDPYGEVAQSVADYLEYADPTGHTALFRALLDEARTRLAAAERDEVARRVRVAIEASGCTRKEFAAAIGTSVPRLSTYATGTVTPSAALLLRMEAVPARRAAAVAPRRAGTGPDRSSRV